jgi:UDP-N-acetylmuramoylalanine--D-glutamate ligase
VVGLARSGVAAARTLLARGEEVVAVDSGSPVLPDGIEAHVRTDGLAFLQHARAVVKSPGVPREAAVIATARARGVPVLGEIELGWRLLPNEFVAVTGTNGKTTTVELLGHIHREAGLPVAVAGNVGTPLTSLVGSLDPAATVVCEASSFQLEDTTAFAPDAAVLLNITPDHLDRHSSFEAYVEAKRGAFKRQPPEAIAVMEADERTELGGQARRVRFGGTPEFRADLELRFPWLRWGRKRLVRWDELGIPGPHNTLNGAAAAAVCLARGLDPDAVRAGLRSFRGVAHRQELIAEVDGVAYVNDSKATNVRSTEIALLAARGAGPTVHLILGGRTKAQDFAPLTLLVGVRCATVHLIGEGAGEIAAALAPTGVPLHEDGDMERAVHAARTAAKPGDTVLLSPACASFDQYPDFEARGEHFRTLVEQL